MYFGLKRGAPVILCGGYIQSQFGTIPSWGEAGYVIRDNGCCVANFIFKSIIGLVPKNNLGAVSRDLRQVDVFINGDCDAIYISGRRDVYVWTYGYRSGDLRPPQHPIHTMYSYGGTGSGIGLARNTVIQF